MVRVTDTATGCFADGTIVIRPADPYLAILIQLQPIATTIITNNGQVVQDI
jgi:uncharacterized protein YukJ